MKDDEAWRAACELRCPEHDGDRDYDPDVPCEACLDAQDAAKRKLEDERARADEDSGAVAWAGQVEIVVGRLPCRQALAAEASAHYRDMGGDSGKTNDRGLAAYARHKYTNYDALLAGLRLKIPFESSSAYSVLRERVDEAVDDALFELEFGDDDQAELAEGPAE